MCTACAIYAVLYLMSGFVNLLTLTLTMPVYVFFNKTKSTQTGAPNNPIVAFVVDVVARVMESVSGFFVQIVVMVIRSVYLLLPVLVFIVLMSMLNAHLDTAMPIIIMAYNRFVVETNAISMIRRMAWIFRITFEIFTPLYNWIIDTVGNSYLDILRLLVDNDNNRSQIMTIVQEIGTLIVTLMRTVVSWMFINFNECSRKTIVQDLMEMQLNPTQTTGLQHRCFDFDYLDLDLAPAVMVGQKIATTAHSLSVSLCPSLASISALVLYPLYDRHMSRIVQNSLNLILGVYYTAQVTHIRCRAAYALSLSTTLCTPDLYPMFRYMERIAESAGLMVDNWLNIAHMMLLSFFMDRDADIVDRCRMNGHNVDTLLTDAMFADRATRLLSCTSSLLAATDGNSVVYTSKNTNQPPLRVQDAFTDSVDVTNGIAAIDFAGSLLETDDNGDARTGILGCKCIDGEEGGQGVSIVCNVALFPAFFDSAHRLQVAQTQIPLLFERGTTGRLLTCRYLRISVQSVRFPAQVFDVSKQSSTGAASYNHDIYSECMADPRKCNTVDAVVYVMPLCPMYSALEKMDAAAEPTECIRDSKYQTCFPYCVALHQKGAGNTPMTLHNKRSLADGVYMAKTRVAMPTDRIVPPAVSANLDASSSVSTGPVTSTCLVSSEFQHITDLTATYCTIQTSNTAGVASFSASDQTMRAPADSCTDSNTACVDDASSGTAMTFLQRATVLHDSQPFIFAGDIILVQVCVLDGTVCQLSTSLFRLTSDIHSQYSIINRMSSIPSIRTSDASKPSEHGGIILPGESNDVIMKRSPAAQTRTGIVYGVNPNPLPFRCLLRGCVLWTKITGCTEIACTNCYQKPQVFFTQPMYKCRGGKFDTVRDANAQNVRACQYDTTTEIKFENQDRFWSVDDDCQQTNSGSSVNLYIEDIVYIDDLNVVISVRRGPVEELLWLVGLNSTAWPADRPIKSRTLHYFLNMETMQIRANAQWTHSTSDVSNGQYSILCQTDNMVPILGTFVASSFNGMSCTSPYGHASLQGHILQHICPIHPNRTFIVLFICTFVLQECGHIMYNAQKTAVIGVCWHRNAICFCVLAASLMTVCMCSWPENDIDRAQLVCVEFVRHHGGDAFRDHAVQGSWSQPLRFGHL